MTKIPRLFQILEERNISRKELSRATGISPGNISDWKTGRSKPSADKLRILSDYLGVSVDYLLGREGATVTGPSAKGLGREERLAQIIEGDEALFRLAEALSSLNDADLEEVERYVDYLVQRQKKRAK
ncbi:MAG: helix-turn-helix domain-containing protein [Clostridiales bacterium]|nr:helix-turn-helix domain-containing protein [Clostridiales bacterium]